MSKSKLLKEMAESLFGDYTAKVAGANPIVKKTLNPAKKVPPSKEKIDELLGNETTGNLEEVYDWIRNTPFAETIFGKTQTGTTRFGARAKAGAARNIKIHRPEGDMLGRETGGGFYEGPKKVKAGKLDPINLPDYRRQMNHNLVSEAAKNWLGELTSPKFSNIFRKTGMSKTTVTEVALHENLARNLRVVESDYIAKYNKLLNTNKSPKREKALIDINKELKNIKRDLNTIKKIQIGQIKGQDMPAMVQGSKTILDPNISWTKHNLPDNVVADIVESQNISKIKKEPLILKTKSNTYANDMFRADNIKMIDYTIAHGKKNNLTLTQIANQINKEIKELTFNEIKKNPKYAKWDDKRINIMVDAMNPPGAKVINPGAFNETLKINSTIMSGDYTAGYAPVITYVDKNFKGGRVLHDVFDGGSMDAWKLALSGDALKHNKSVLLNRLWNIGQDKIVVQVSDMIPVNFNDVHKLTASTLRTSPMWTKVQRRAGFKRAVNKIAKEYNLTTAEAEDVMLTLMDNRIGAGVSSTTGPLKSMQKTLEGLQPKGGMNNSQLQKLIERDLTEIGPEKMMQILDSQDEQLVYLSTLRTNKAARNVAKKEKFRQPKGKGTKLKPTPKLSKNIQKVIDNATSEYNRSTNIDDVVKFTFRNAVKVGIPAGYAGYQVIDSVFDFDEEED